MKKLKTFFGVLFLIVGILMVSISSIIKIENVNFMKTAEKTDAVVTKVSTIYYHRRGFSNFIDELFYQYKIYIQYEVNGKTYSGYLKEAATYGSGKGSYITIYYDSANPNNFRRDSQFELYFFVCIVVGASLMTAGMLLNREELYNQMEKRRHEKLKVRGKMVMADIDNITMDKKCSNGNSHLYYVTCSYRDPVTDCFYEFQSTGVQSEKDLEIFAEIQNITSVPVYMDEKNPKKYVVDTNRFKSCTYN